MVEREIKYRSLKIASQLFGGAVEMCAKPWWGLLKVTLHTSFLAIDHLASPLMVICLESEVHGFMKLYR
jgi:hypothetical protein